MTFLGFKGSVILFSRALRGLKDFSDGVRMLYSKISPARRKREQLLKMERINAERIFREIADESSSHFRGASLIDGTYDNPNFWYRLTLVRAALGLRNGSEVGVTGDYRESICRRSFHNIGISQVVRFKDYMPPSQVMRKQARKLLKNSTQGRDILSWDLPFGFPASQAYDAILKWQRKATIDINAPLLEDYLTSCLRKLYAADNLLDALDIKLAVVSQPINFDQGGLAWCASIRNIPSVICTGHGGLTRLRKGFRLDRVFAGGDRPTRDDMDNLSEIQLAQLRALGSNYLDDRINGLTNELGSIYAYQRRRSSITKEELTTRLEWDSETPIVVVYAANWFDYPHSHGMKNFSDYLDWINVTLYAANETRTVNWLFKAHPCDDWYGGETLRDYLPSELPKHIALAPKDINSKELIDCVDAMVTVCGTGALEFAHLLKPALVADRGWYDDIGFTVNAKSREDYSRLLKTRWWNDFEAYVARDRCHAFTGMMFCCPEWQGRLVCGQDTEQWALYNRLSHMVLDDRDSLNIEIDGIGRWYKSSSEGYHTFKMSQAKRYTTTHRPDRDATAD